MDPETDNDGAFVNGDDDRSSRRGIGSDGESEFNMYHSTLSLALQQNPPGGFQGNIKTHFHNSSIQSIIVE